MDDGTYNLIGSAWECNGIVIEFLSSSEVAVYESLGDYYATGVYELEDVDYIHFYYLQYITPYDDRYDPYDPNYTTYIFSHANIIDDTHLEIYGHYYNSYTTHLLYSRIY